MNPKITIILLSAGTAVILAFVLWQYLFSIYEVTFRVFPTELSADFNSTVEIDAIPVNAFGFKAPLRNSPSEFEIIEGVQLVEVIKKDGDKGELILRAKGEPGKVVVKIRTKYSLWPALIEVPIRPNTA